MRYHARRTMKQRIIMDIIMRAMDEGRDISIADVHREVPYECTYGAVRISIKFLTKHGLIVAEPGPMNRSFYKPTVSGLAWFRSGG